MKANWQPHVPKSEHLESFPPLSISPLQPFLASLGLASKHSTPYQPGALVENAKSTWPGGKHGARFHAISTSAPGRIIPHLFKNLKFSSCAPQLFRPRAPHVGPHENASKENPLTGNLMCPKPSTWKVFRRFPFHPFSPFLASLTFTLHAFEKRNPERNHDLKLG